MRMPHFYDALSPNGTYITRMLFLYIKNRAHQRFAIIYNKRWLRSFNFRPSSFIEGKSNHVVFLTLSCSL